MTGRATGAGRGKAGRDGQRTRIGGASGGPGRDRPTSNKATSERVNLKLICSLIKRLLWNHNLNSLNSNFVVCAF